MARRDSLSLTITQPLNLIHTIESGQAFRWKRHGEWYFGVIRNNLIALRQYESQLDVRSSPSPPEQIEQELRDYLRLDDDLSMIYSCIDKDPYINRAISEYHGLRILRQDPWECLISFICSANSNIPRISASMNAIAKSYGLPLTLDKHVDYSFPTPTALACAGETELRKLKLGFRAKYVAKAAERVASGEIELEPLRHVEYEEAKRLLMSFPGVGDKVADCVLLFSLDKLSSCPIDRWVRRAIEEWYLDGEKLNYKSIRDWCLETWGEYAGYAQQYLFQHKRLM